ncbi:O-antigen ligase family protein [Dermabacteraceae bacterium P7054]
MSTDTKTYRDKTLALSEKGEERLRRVGDRAYEVVGSIVIIDFIAGMLIVGDGYVIAGGSLPLSTLSIGIMALVGFFRTPKNTVGNYFAAFVIVGFAILWTALVSLYVGGDLGDIVRRMVRIAAVVLAGMFIIEGRIDSNSLLKGLGFGLVANLVLFYAGIAPDRYAGLLTGFLGDKNKAGLYYLVGGMLAMIVVRKNFYLLLTVVGLTASIWLTGSRTTLAGLLMGLLWITVVTRFSRGFRLLWVGVIIFAVNYMEENFARAGNFADRIGSDLLRERIDSATAVKISETPWYGQGYGTARVEVEGLPWFFHNSYLTLQVEGGIPYMVAIIAVTVAIGFGPFRATNYTRELRIAEGAVVGLLICAWKLGEVFLTNAWMLVIAAVILAVLNREREDADSLWLRKRKEAVLGVES